LGGHGLGALIARLRRNVAIILSGNAVVAVLGFATLALNARALGPELLGVMALLQAFTGVVGRVFSFDTWQPTIRFGTEALVADDKERLRDIIALGFVFDCSAAITATLTAFVVIAVALPFVGIASENQTYVTIYAVTLLLGVSSTATGVLRLFNRFAVFSGIQVVAAAAALVAATLLFALEAPFLYYVVTYAGITAAQSLGTVVSAVILSKRRALPPFRSAKLSNLSLFRSFAGFSWASSGMSTINVLRQNADTFLLAAVLGPAATGVYKVAVQIASLILRVADPMQQALFPEVSSLAARGDLTTLRRLLLRGCLISTAFALCAFAGVALFGGFAIQLVGGPAYADAEAPLLWLTLAYGLAISGFWVRPTVVTLIGPQFHFLTYVIAAAAFAPALYFGIGHMGLTGAGLSQVVFNLVFFITNLLALQRRFRRQAQ
jgi:O-antigen/teichoic acid export membrane protein